MENCRNEHNSIKKEKEEEFWNIILVSQGCHNKISQTEWFKQQKFISRASGGWESEVGVSTSLVFPEASFPCLDMAALLLGPYMMLSLCDTTLMSLCVSEFTLLKRNQ